jgi:phosphopantothenoylcysteine decarboxylase/phosphopantothenate--cysteine ligase
MTKEATELVGPLTFRTLSGNPVLTNLYNKENLSLPVPHISLAQKADLVVIAPCTANVIGKIAHGIADEALTTTVLASTAPKLLAPAMNCEMWRNPIVQANVKKLGIGGLGYWMIGPVEGKLACGEEDIGRMAEPEDILARIIEILIPKQDLKGKHVLVTAGGTREALDPVRFIANRSSGKMGYALAEAARKRGATVTLIAANIELPSPLDIKPIRVETAEEMLRAVREKFSQTDVLVMAAAVGDFKFKQPTSNFKIKKTKRAKLKIQLEENVDILETVAKEKGRKGKIMVGFALETENEIKNAKLKMKNKGLDLIVANGPATFNSNKIKFALINRTGKVKQYSEQTKEQAADVILDQVAALS